MAEIIRMPRLSDTMEQGTVSKWLKKVNDAVEEGDILAEIETDKAVQEFESFNSGILLYIGVAEGESANVDSVLAVIGEKGESYEGLLEEPKSSTVSTTSETQNTEKSPKEDQATPKEDQATPVNIDAEVIKMPRLSDTMKQGTVSKWLKKVGDTIREGDILAEIETDKAVQEFEAFIEGTLLHIGVEEGQSAEVDTILAIVGKVGTDISSLLKGNAKVSKSDENKEDLGSKEVKTDQSPSSEKVDGQRVMISPLARKMAKERGIDINKLKGTGEHGRIVKRDIEGYKEIELSLQEKPIYISDKPVQPQTVGAAHQFIPVESSEIPVNQMRSMIAKRLAESKFSAPHYYLSMEIDMDQVIQDRKMMNSIPDTKISFNDIVVKAVACALQDHPKVNSSWMGDKIVMHGNINIGVAVAVDDGLLVPVVKHANIKSLSTIGREIKDLAYKARSRKIALDEMEGSTFTVSNLGMFGIDFFTSIINQPNSCIMSIGSIGQKPIVKNGEIVVGNTMRISLACDHRTVDGATGAAFLKTFKEKLENPVTLLV